MTRRRRRARSTPPADWIEHREARVNGRLLTPGVEVSIRGECGRFRFMRRIERPERGVEWLDFWGGPKNMPAWRSFRADQVRRVHRLRRTETALAEEHRAKRAALRQGAA